MSPDDLWPGILLIALSISIGILACTTLIVLSIIFERHAACEEETMRRRTNEEEPPTEGYCTFERSLHATFDDDDATVNGKRRRAGMYIIPKKFRQRRERRQRREISGIGANHRWLVKPTPTPVSDRNGHNEGFLEDALPSRTLSVAHSPAGLGDETASLTSRLVTQAPTKARNARAECENHVHDGREELLFNMSV